MTQHNIAMPKWMNQPHICPTCMQLKIQMMSEVHSRRWKQVGSRSNLGKQQVLIHSNQQQHLYFLVAYLLPATTCKMFHFLHFFGYLEMPGNGSVKWTLSSDIIGISICVIFIIHFNIVKLIYICFLQVKSKYLKQIACHTKSKWLSPFTWQ